MVKNVYYGLEDTLRVVLVMLVMILLKGVLGLKVNTIHVQPKKDCTFLVKYNIILELK